MEVKKEFFVSEGYMGVKKEFGIDENKTLDDLYRAMREGTILQGAVYGAEWGKEESEEPSLVIDLGGFKGLLAPEERGDGLPPKSSLAIGSILVFKIKRIDRANRLVYLSRKEALEEVSARTWDRLMKNAELIEIGEKIKELEKQLREKQEGERSDLFQKVSDLRRRALEIAPIMTATVRWVQRRRVHLDIGGVPAVLPAELAAWHRPSDLAELFKPGDAFDVKIIGIDPEKKEVTANLKALLPDPWEYGIIKYVPNGLYLGRVVRKWPNGVIMIEFEPGIVDTAKPEEEVPVGAQVLYHIPNVNHEGRRIHGVVVRFL
ncbi:MAG: hypothetical protein QXP27_09710, partial [Candidatus Methanomethyliaceae archaeon]